MKLSELNAEFIALKPEGGDYLLHRVDTLAQAQGVLFLCPKCFRANNGPMGTHRIICWTVRAPDDARPAGRWQINGTDMTDLTFAAVPPYGARSVLLQGGCRWHGFIVHGEAHDS